ncbi:hypothetical protein R1flu_005732 [Riccia fluitans]|uniref:Uncharacterized protein n=1 Tax=Riccia fluitans TaxID=41844 RepID=A0ABD1YUQ2_9MARC
MAARAITPFKFLDMLHKLPKVMIPDRWCVILDINTRALHFWKIGKLEEPELTGVMVYCMFVNYLLDAIIYVGDDHYKDKEVEEAKRIRKGKEKASHERKKKKDSSFALEKLLIQSRCAAKSQATRDRVLDDIPLPSLIMKRKPSALGRNILSGDQGQNVEPAEEPSADGSAILLQKKVVVKLAILNQLGESHADKEKTAL